MACDFSASDGDAGKDSRSIVGRDEIDGGAIRGEARTRPGRNERTEKDGK